MSVSSRISQPYIYMVRDSTRDDNPVKTNRNNAKRIRTRVIGLMFLLCSLYGVYSNIILSSKSLGLILERASSITSQQQHMVESPESNSMSGDEEDEGPTNDFAKIAMRKRVGTYLSGNNPPLPPHTPGAFIHVGKTGGSTLARYLRNGCHSFVPKPCNTVNRYLLNESYISKTTTYSKSKCAMHKRVRVLLGNTNDSTANNFSTHTAAVHYPDFDSLGKAITPITNYSFFVLTIRDPFDRFLSTFTYQQHPVNKFVFEKELASKIELTRTMTPLYKCFPTLETFTDYIGDDPDSFHYNYTLSTVNNGGRWEVVANASNCTNLARAMMKNKVPPAATRHFYWDLKTIMAKSVLLVTNKVPVLVIRTEQLWDDWASANRYLGQSSRTVVTFPDGARGRDFSSRKGQLAPKVTKEISKKGRERLCRALAASYRAYLGLVYRSVNLTPDEKQDSLDRARENCPRLLLAFVLVN
jgi:hypothetical protein